MHVHIHGQPFCSDREVLPDASQAMKAEHLGVEQKGHLAAPDFAGSLGDLKERAKGIGL